jgi:anti-sigma B factor antagonist
MSNPLSLELRDDVLTATVAGNIDGQSAPGLQNQLLDALTSATSAVLDVSQVAYMSSAGFRMLLLVYRSLAIKGGRLALVGLSDEIRDTMSMTGFLDFFVLSQSLEEAIEQVTLARSASEGASR